jgi:3-methyladenine DNA glycosylase AlkD
MTYDEVIVLLEENRNERGVAHWQKVKSRGELKSFGIGLTQLRKLAKKVGRDHDLALELWGSDVYDAKVLGALVDEPKKMTREQAQSQVEDTHIGMLAHVYCSCDATLAKAAFAQELSVLWTDSADDLRRRCGYLLLYELGKKKGKALDDAFFETYVDRIRETIHDEKNWVRDAMNGSLLSIGKRNAYLHEKTLAAAKTIGPVEVDYGDNSCEPPDIVKHLTSDYVLKKLGK